MMWRRPSLRRAGRVRGAPRPTAGPRARPGAGARALPPGASGRPQFRIGGRSGLVARIGALPLIALTCSVGLLTVLFCALFVPGLVVPADADTTSSTQAVPVEGVPGQPTTTDPAPIRPVPAEPAPGRRLVTLPWGAGDGQVGIVQPAEGLTRGPEALAVAPDGRIVILDTMNSRLVLLAADGSFSGTIPLTLAQPRFLTVDNGLIYVLDADADQQLLCMDWQGAQIHTAQLPELDDVVTGLFATADGPCVEVAHDEVFAVEFKDNSKQGTGDGAAAATTRATPTGQATRPAPAALHSIAGRPLDHDLTKATKITFRPKAGVTLKRFKVDKKTYKGVQTRASAPAFGAGTTIEHLISVDGDGRGGVIIGARLLRGKGDPKDAPSLIVGRLAAGADQTSGAPVLTEAFTLSDSPFAYLGQPYTVAPDGRIFQPVGSDAGYSIFVYSLPGTEEVQP